MHPSYEDSVFLNVPFDLRYRSLLYALVFAVHDCGFVARCALEMDDASQIRIEKIYELIEAAKYGIHDISRTALDSRWRLPRFNMPLELGLFLGAKRFGTGNNREKRCLVLDREEYRYQKYCSDIAGQDIRPHHNRPPDAIKVVRNWLRSSPDTDGIKLPGGDRIVKRYQVFRQQMPVLCCQVDLTPRELIFNDYTTLIAGWLAANPR